MVTHSAEFYVEMVEKTKIKIYLKPADREMGGVEGVCDVRDIYISIKLR